MLSRSSSIGTRLLIAKQLCIGREYARKPHIVRSSGQDVVTSNRIETQGLQIMASGNDLRRC